MSYIKFLKANDTKQLQWMRQEWTAVIEVEKENIEQKQTKVDKLEERLKLINEVLRERDNLGNNAEPIVDYPDDDPREVR